VAVIRFPVLNGAMSVARSHALATAIREARDAKVILLTGGPEFWCNGIDLATIEAADSPAEESLAAIEAIDDVCQALLETTGSWTMAAMAGNAGAGGVFMALAADRSWRVRARFSARITRTWATSMARNTGPTPCPVASGRRARRG
jgi:putative two-component system hydrogenase maturation factor HypX/HoxX